MASMPPQKKGFSPILTALIGIGALLLLIAIGATAFLVFRGSGTEPGQGSASGGAGEQKQSQYRNEMALVKGGKFKMGRTGGAVLEVPEHEVEVADFYMDKVEVTNGEYFDFVKATGYAPPRHFENGKPISGDAERPVRFVSIDDVKAFAKWRSQRDGVEYRLPTEQEWEYAARNGADQALYPWGNNFDDGRAVVDRPSTAPEMVGSKPSGANKWGVLDLIGNVWEWTDSKINCYPGNEECTIKESPEPQYMIRGGSAERKSAGNDGIRSTTRAWGEASKRDATLGFRLVRKP